MMTEIYTLKPGYKLPSRNQATRLTEMRNELIMGEDKMHACMTRYLTKLLILLALLSGLLIFRAVADPRNSPKNAKYREIRQKYFQIHVGKTYLVLILAFRPVLFTPNVQIYLETLSLQ